MTTTIISIRICERTVTPLGETADTQWIANLQDDPIAELQKARDYIGPENSHCGKLVGGSPITPTGSGLTRELGGLLALAAFLPFSRARPLCAVVAALGSSNYRSLANPSSKSLVRSVARTLNHEGLSTCRKIIIKNAIRFPKTERTEN